MRTKDLVVQKHRIMAAGVELNVFDWPGESASSPVMLMMHGYRANAHWWDDLIEEFAGQYRIILPEFSGMGESDWRSRYSHWHGAEDLEAVFESLDIVADVAVAHSWGGYQMAAYCRKNPFRVRQLILIDSFFMVGPDTDVPVAASIGNIRVYQSKSQAIQRFRTSPRQPIPEHRRLSLARASLREVDGGWTWSYDPKLPIIAPNCDDVALLAELQTPCDYILAGAGEVVSRERGQAIADLARCRSFIVFEDAHHHLMLEHPKRLAGCIQNLILDCY